MQGRIFTRVEMLCQLQPIFGHALRDFNDVRRIWLPLQRNRPEIVNAGDHRIEMPTHLLRNQELGVKLFRRPL